jgi:hypothetical protein
MSDQLLREILAELKTIVKKLDDIDASVASIESRID